MTAALPPTRPSASEPAAVPARRPTVQHRVEYGALRAVLGALSALPWRAASAFGARLGRIGYAPAGIRRAVVERQIAACFPEFTPEQVRATAIASYESLGRTTVEGAVLGRLGREAVLDLFPEVEGWEHLEAALALGRGCIVATGHIGNWELGGSYVAARGVGIDAIARRMANPLFDGWITRARQRLGMRVVWDGEAVRRTPRALRENRMVVFLSDQGALGLASSWVPFFGRPAKTPRGAAVFALRMDVPVLFAASLRRPDGRYRFVIEPVVAERTGDRERDVDAIVLAYTQALERWVRREPGQYFWQHRRWRHQPPDTPAHLREP